MSYVIRDDVSDTSASFPKLFRTWQAAVRHLCDSDVQGCAADAMSELRKAKRDEASCLYLLRRKQMEERSCLSGSVHGPVQSIR